MALYNIVYSKRSKTIGFYNQTSKSWFDIKKLLPARASSVVRKGSKYQCTSEPDLIRINRNFSFEDITNKELLRKTLKRYIPENSLEKHLVAILEKLTIDLKKKELVIYFIEVNTDP